MGRELYWSMSDEDLRRYLSAKYGVAVTSEVKQDLVNLAYTLDSFGNEGGYIHGVA